jgi:hypothetical protein
MMQRILVRIVLAFLVITLAGTYVYLQYREKSIRSMESTLDSMKAGKTRLAVTATGLGTLKKTFPPRLDVPSFAGDLYLCAKNAGVKNHEVTSLPGKEIGGTAQKKGDDRKTAKVITYQLKIAFEGDFRSAAEYIRQMQNIGRYKRIIDLEMKPDKDTLKTVITIELVSFGNENAA